VTCQRITRQRLDKHPAIRTLNNGMNVYSSLLGNSQRANGMARQQSRDVFSVGAVSSRVELCLLWGLCRRIIRGSRIVEEESRRVLVEFRSSRVIEEEIARRLHSDFKR
jgi:hypothetical protein